MRAFVEGQEKQLMGEVNKRILAELEEYGKMADRYGLIHADFSQENISRNGDDFILIDFDDCGFGWNMFELTTALVFYQPHPLYKAYEKALFRGDESILPISEASRKIMAGFAS